MNNNINKITLTTKNDFEKAMERVYAWYNNEIIDRVPVQFSAANAQYNVESKENRTPQEWKEIWFDTERVVDSFIDSIKGCQFLGETFPIYWPNLGPDIYAAFYGGELTYGEVTSWSHPIVKDWSEISELKLDKKNKYFRKIEEMTQCAIEKCQGRYLVGYTDLHPSMDCVLAWRGMEQLCYDMIDTPDKVSELLEIASRDFYDIFDHFDNMLKSQGHISVTWLGVPSYGKFHVPSCDFATMMSPAQFDKFAMPYLLEQIKHMDHNVFHVDGSGVARHIDKILDMPEINGIQWVQGVGEDEPIMQWLDLIKKMQDAGKGIMVDLKLHELDEFIQEMSPRGIFLCIGESEPEVQKSIIKKLEKWKS
ncbi:Uroporphyrinogen decarboxylase (URO-D) [Sedimentisphaera cyanobacteriorum]|uniref:Uroporphyrinogen decarboxylase (URO-D) n=1 Tax=Sedimentisphaera cyanobacteriorum TaxID=1940790 RepID=A0A1Q2HMW0_9BACT|nr:Uroporphyrinogen decarboxylase (URO-D) [Sedimentisphaera cyanobacteriorum]